MDLHGFVAGRKQDELEGMDLPSGEHHDNLFQESEGHPCWWALVCCLCGLSWISIMETNAIRHGGIS